MAQRQAAEDQLATSALPVSSGNEDPYTALLTLVALKFDRERLTVQHNWKADVPTEEWSGVVFRVLLDGRRELVELNGETPPLRQTLRLADLGPSLVTDRLVVLKFLGASIKGDLAPIEACTSLRTLVLHDTKVCCTLWRIESSARDKLFFLALGRVRPSQGVHRRRVIASFCVVSLLHARVQVKGSLRSLEGLVHLRRLNLSRSRCFGSISSLAKCTELQTVILSDTSKRLFKPLRSCVPRALKRQLPAPQLSASLVHHTTPRSLLSAVSRTRSIQR